MSITVWIIGTVILVIINYLVGYAQGMAKERALAQRIGLLEGAEERDAPRDPNAPAAVIHLADLRRDRNAMQN